MAAGNLVVKQGYLDTSLSSREESEGYFSLWRRNFFVLYGATYTAPGRLARFKTEDKQKDDPEHCEILLEDMQAVQLGTMGCPECFRFRLSIGAYYYCKAQSLAEAREWYILLKENIDMTAQARESRGIGNHMEVVDTAPPRPGLQLGQGEGKVFVVTVAESEASKRCHLPNDKTYILCVQSEEIVLVTDASKRLYAWPFKVIRRFRYSPKRNFSLEAGTAAASGEGLFRFQTNFAEDIMQEVKVKKSALMLRRQATPQAPMSGTSSEAYLTPVPNPCPSGTVQRRRAQVNFLLVPDGYLTTTRQTDA